MTLSEFHGRLGNTALMFFLILSLWGYWRFFRKQGIDSNYWGALAIGELLLFAQAGLGAYLWLAGLHPERWVHMLYGVVALMAVPAAYAFTRGRDERPDMLIHSTTTLITVGLIFRAISTAFG